VDEKSTVDFICLYITNHGSVEISRSIIDLSTTSVLFYPGIDFSFCGTAHILQHTIYSNFNI